MKALKTLGATEEEVRFEHAYVVSMAHSQASQSPNRYFIECTDEDLNKTKPERALGIAGGMPPLEWLQRQNSGTSVKRSLPSKALLTLGATIDDVRIEKALLVLGEAPGREVPAGRLPRPSLPVLVPEPPVWAVPPTKRSYHGGVSVFLCAFLPWGVLAPLNFLKLQLNRVRIAHMRA